MSRAFVKEDDGLVEFRDMERARQERLELLHMFEKKRDFLLNPDPSLDIPEEKRKELLEKIEAEIATVREKLEMSDSNL